MRHLELKHTEASVIRGINRYWARRIGIFLPLSFIGLIAVIAYLVSVGQTDWFVGVLAAVALIFPIVFLSIYLWHRRDSLSKFRSLEQGRVNIRYSDELFEIEAPNGTSSLPWTTFTDLWSYPDLMLLFFNASQFITLPISDLANDDREHLVSTITSKVKNASPPN